MSHFGTQSITALKGYASLVIVSLSTLLHCHGQQNNNGRQANLSADFTPVITEPGPPAKQQNGSFTLVALPDTQFYVASMHDGTPEMFKAQVDWIVENREAENIAYVAHLGDLTEHGDSIAQEWSIAKDMMYALENPVSIPYGITVGNHDQFPAGHPVTGTTNYYNKYFGVAHFQGRPYYGGHYGSNNDSHYDLFSAGGVDFIVVYFEYDADNEDQANVNNWAYNLLNTYASRKAIIVSHYLIGHNTIAGSNDGEPGTFGAQGQAIYDRLRGCPNLFMMLCGHVGGNGGEGFRADVYQDNTVRTFLSDYQSRPYGGNGLLRLYRISVERNQIDVKTFSPYTHEYETDGDSQFSTRFFNQR